MGDTQLHTGVQRCCATAGFLQHDLRLREAKGVPFPPGALSPPESPFMKGWRATGKSSFGQKKDEEGGL